MKKEMFDEILRDAVNDAELGSADIPSIDLYVDQIINLISEKLKEGSPRFYDRQLTKTMINNYSKDGLITPVNGKKYNKEQIVQMLTVYTLKGTLSIGEIKRILDGAYATEGFDGNALTELYDRYLHIKQNNREYSRAVVEEIIENNSIDTEDDLGFITALGAIVSMSAYLKNIAQALIDERYPQSEPDVDKDKKDKTKDKEKEKNKEKEKEKDKDKSKDKSKEKKKKKQDDTASQPDEKASDSD